MMTGLVSGASVFADEPESVDDKIVNVWSAGENGEIIPNILLFSYNPGFSDPYIGEFFEMKKLSKTSISLAGLSVIYETSTGSEYVVYEFPDGDEMIGESLLMRLANSDEVKVAEEKEVTVADATYTRNMSQSSGRIKLKYDDRVFDSLCWGLKEDDCAKAFSPKKPTTLVRELNDDEIGDFIHNADYKPVFDATKTNLKHAEKVEEIVEPQCRSLGFSEILTYYETSSAEQFIEVANNGEETVKLEGCFIKYKNKNYALTGEIKPNEIRAFYPASEWKLTLTKNPVSANMLSIVDTDGETVDNLTYYSGQRKGVSLAFLGYGSDGGEKWLQTYNPTPGAENIYQQFKTCPIGKAINLETGNCVNETPAVSELVACPEGKYRNPLTGRCKSYATTASTELKPCAEGYERNPETNRCRKVVANTGADYPVATGSVEEKKELVSVWTIATVVVAGLGYIIFQYKAEIATLFSHRRAQ